MIGKNFSSNRGAGADRILMVFIGQKYSGGSWTHINNLKTGLEKRNALIDIISLNNLWRPLLYMFISGPAFILQKINCGAGTVYNYKMRKIFLFLRLFFFFLFNHINAVNAEDVISCNVLFYLKKIFRYKLLFTVHGDFVNECLSDRRLARGTWPEKMLLREETFAYNHADAIVAVDTRLKQHVKGYLKSDIPVEVIFNFVDPEIFKPDADMRRVMRKENGIDEGTVVLFCPRRLSTKCGVIYAVQAFNLFHKRFNNSMLILVGKGVEQENIERHIKLNDLKSSVLFLGDVSLDIMLKLYNLTDYVIIPSIMSEGMVEASSLSAIEAMACKKVVIASNVGGLKEIVIDGETGILVPQKDPEAIYEKINYLRQFPDLYQKLAENARNHVKINLSTNEAVGKYLRLYGIDKNRR